MFELTKEDVCDLFRYEMYVWKQKQKKESEAVENSFGITDPDKNQIVDVTILQ